MSEKGFKNYLNRYEYECTLPGAGQTVKYKPLTTNQMKQLLEYEDENDLAKLSEAMDKLIESAVISEDFDINEIYLRDRFFLLIQIRKKTKGEIYEFQLTCQKCKSQDYGTVDLDKLEVKEMDVESGTVQVADDVEVEIGHIKRKDEKEAVNNFSNTDTKSDREREMEYWTNLLAASIRSITTPDGTDTDLSFDDKIFIINNTTQATLEKIGKWFTDNWFGLNFEIEKECSSCGNKYKESIPMNQLFS